MADIDNPKVQKILNATGFAHLATIGPDGEPQSSPMWYLWDGDRLKFTHTTDRQKYRNIKRDPHVAVSITDIDDPYTSVDLRGVIDRIEDDPNGAFYDTLAERYGSPGRYTGDPRVILSMRVDHVTGQKLGS